MLIGLCSELPSDSHYGQHLVCADYNKFSVKSISPLHQPLEPADRERSAAKTIHHEPIALQSAEPI